MSCGHRHALYTYGWLVVSREVRFFTFDSLCLIVISCTLHPSLLGLDRAPRVLPILQLRVARAAARQRSLPESALARRLPQWRLVVERHSLRVAPLCTAALVVVAWAQRV